MSIHDFWYRFSRSRKGKMEWSKDQGKTWEAVPDLIEDQFKTKTVAALAE